MRQRAARCCVFERATGTMPLRDARKASSTEIDSKVCRFTEAWGAVNKAQDDDEQRNDIVALLAELMANPKKIKGCRRAVASDLFLKSEEKATNPKDFFAESTKYMWKVPKHGCAALFSRLIGRKFSDVTMNKWAEKDKAVFSKMLYRLAVVESQTPLPSLLKADFYSSMTARHKTMKIGDPFDWKAAQVDWNICGFFRLLPPAPAASSEAPSNLAEHRFSEVELLGKWTATHYG